MGNIATGASMVLLVLVVNVLVAFIQTGAASSGSIAGCDGDDNFTSCETVSTGSFIHAFLSVTVTGLDGAPLIFNVLYVLLLGSVLAIGGVLIVTGLIPTVPG